MIKDKRTGREVFGPKSKGNVMHFEMVMWDNTAVVWDVLTGRPGYAFWNVTNKCELIGKKYTIADYLT